MATPRQEGESRGTSPGSDAKIPENRGYRPGMKAGAGGGMRTGGEPALPAERGYRGGMTDAQESEKHAPEVLSGAAALPLSNTATPWKLGGGGGTESQNRGGSDPKVDYTPGHKPGRAESANSETGGPSPMKGMGR